MNVTKLGQIRDGQDGAIWGNYLFRLDASGNCTVYTLSPLEEVGRFTLDQVAQMKPHSNSVMFGNEFYCPEDPFPLLYSNIYNNYASAEDKMKGVTCVYRVWLENEVFQSQLVQVIRIGFADSSLWQSENGVFTNSDGEIFSSTSGLIPVFVMIVAAVVMVLCGVLMKLLKWKWLTDYALPLSMVLGMASAIPLTALLGG